MSVKSRCVLCGLLALIAGFAACAASWAVDGQQPDNETAPPQKAARYGAVVRGKAETDQGETDRVPPRDEEIADPALAEILEIRRRLGESPFRGTIFEQTNNATDGASGESETNPETDFNRAFSDALKSVAADAADRPPIIEPAPDVRVPFSQTWVDTDFVGSLRQAARALDNKAADLEPLRRYREADQLRRLATQIRRRAREYDGVTAIDR